MTDGITQEETLELWQLAQKLETVMGSASPAVETQAASNVASFIRAAKLEGFRNRPLAVFGPPCWQPIATAPRGGGGRFSPNDGPDILLCAPAGRVCLGHWSVGFGFGPFSAPGFYVSGFPVYPTHWMPLPEAPEPGQ